MDTLTLVVDTVLNAGATAGFPPDATWLQTTFLYNTIRAYLYSAAFIVIGWLLVLFLDRVVLRRFLTLAARTESAYDDLVITSLKRYGIPALYVVVFYLGLRDLHMREAVAKALQLGVYFWVCFNAVRLLSGLIQIALERHMESRAESSTVAEQEKKSVRGILVFVKILLWILALILVMDNLGMKVTTFVAGLGISGIAIALAAQTILGDLFAYFVIVFDRPFQVGHSIKVGNFQGEIESIGVKTSRIRSLTGETVIVSNKFLTDNQVQNFRLMKRRRMTALFEVEYATPASTLREIPGLIRDLVRQSGPKGLTTFDRCHLKEIADSGLRYELVYFVESPSMAVAVDVQQELNIRIKEAFDTRGIAFAFSTRTLNVQSVGVTGAASTGVAPGGPEGQGAAGATAPGTSDPAPAADT